MQTPHGYSEDHRERRSGEKKAGPGARKSLHVGSVPTSDVAAKSRDAKQISPEGLASGNRVRRSGPNG